MQDKIENISTNNTQVDNAALRQQVMEAIDLILRPQTDLDNIADTIFRAQTSLSLLIQSDTEDVELSQVELPSDRDDVEKLTQIIIAGHHVNAESECSICTEPFQVGDDARQMPCHESYIFHARCLVQWLERRNTCPICRTRLLCPINGSPDYESEEFITSTTSIIMLVGGLVMGILKLRGCECI
ncbi:E3 ubiquitin-protein ligase RDUF1-like [Cryptomeria japonica]|uniref:E3 ubiquitin-protein ligase RDUF1-like n=1 Tax=Cryptomeria japonica TaxID=3369 RepID=UPI0027D9DCCA|nr:E3 ubiquitin-protein ligase RDUF1-like [Cryptomeria japonica]